jgi:UDP:flavonoid glycosyltransferase YjiC (YdhE family)
MAAAEGVLCGAGFETPAEALFLNKKLMVIPMKNQFEQQCNAAALKQMGVPVIKILKKKHVDKIKTWVEATTKVSVAYTDDTATILKNIVDAHSPAKAKTILVPGKRLYTLKEFRDISLKKIIKQLQA